MCGRYTLVKKLILIGEDKVEENLAAIAVEDGAPEFQPRYNIAPTQENWIVRRQPEIQSLVASPMRWGLVPSWSKSGTTQSLYQRPLRNDRRKTVLQSRLPTTMLPRPCRRLLRVEAARQSQPALLFPTRR